MGGLTIPAEITSEFPRWHVWRTRRMCFASRRGHVLSSEEMYAGLVMTVGADSLEELRAELATQRSRARKFEMSAT